MFDARYKNVSSGQRTKRAGEQHPRRSSGPNKRRYMRDMRQQHDITLGRCGVCVWSVELIAICISLMTVARAARPWPEWDMPHTVQL